MADFHYRCTRCDATHEPGEVRYLCPACEKDYVPGEPLTGVLEAVFDYQKSADATDPRAPNGSLFCAVNAKFHPPFPVGGTPLVPAGRLGAHLGFPLLYAKNDGLNPSGSLKDRASFLVAAQAAQLGEKRVVTASTGNAAVALAAVCAAADLEALIFVPETAPQAKVAPMLLYGARVIRIRGSYDDAFRLSLEYTKTRGGLNRNTAYNPLTIEGKKTAAFEIYRQCGRAPDSVIVPVGDGVILAGVYKGFKDLLLAGWIESLPRLVCVQAESSDAIHRLVISGGFSPAPNPKTIADSLSVSAPANAFMAQRAVRESNGLSVTVTDDEIMEAQRLLAQRTGIYAEPAAAAAVAGLPAAKNKGLDPEGLTVLLITGHGMKDPDAVLQKTALPPAGDPDLARLGL